MEEFAREDDKLLEVREGSKKNISGLQMFLNGVNIRRKIFWLLIEPKGSILHKITVTSVAEPEPEPLFLARAGAQTITIFSAPAPTPAPDLESRH